MNIIFKESKHNYRTGTKTTWEIFHSWLIFLGITIIIIILLFKLFITSEIKEKPNSDESSNNIVEIETVNDEQLSINHELHNSLDNSTYTVTNESNNPSPQKLKIKLKHEEKIRKELIKKQEKEIKKAEKNLKKSQRKAEKDRKNYLKKQKKEAKKEEKD